MLDTVKNELIDEKYLENVQDDKTLSDSTVQIDNNVDTFKIKNKLDEKTREILRLTHQLNSLEKVSLACLYIFTRAVKPTLKYNTDST